MKTTKSDGGELERAGRRGRRETKRGELEDSITRQKERELVEEMHMRKQSTSWEIVMNLRAQMGD